MEEMTDTDLPSVRGKVREELAEGIAITELPLLGEYHDRHRGKRLAHRGQVERRGRPDRGLLVQVGQTVALLVQDPAVLDHHDRRSGSIGFDTQQGVDLP